MEGSHPMFRNKYLYRLSTFRIILLSFAGAILTGAFLLCLPFARRGAPVSFLDALFTATSAVCVTGLVVRDTYLGWSIFGRVVIISLIQIGGMGVVTIAILLAIVSGKKISLRQRTLLKDAISEDRVGGILRLTSFILRFTLFCELVGTLLMLPVFSATYGIRRGLGYAVFHSISAFCNAGFDLSGGRSPYSSLTWYASNPLMNLTIIGLIVTGGLGFGVIADIGHRKLKVHRYRLQTKVVLFQTAVLILLPALYFFLFECKAGPVGTRLLEAFFQSVTTRTAGFNTIDLTKLSDSGIMLMIVLMLIGGAPGSTAGGMKTTTFFVLLVSTFAVFGSKRSASVFHRRISAEPIRKAAALFMTYITLFLLAAMIISRIEGLPLLTCMFETASAIGTVGLTLGITPQLGAVSHLILIFLMFFGRVGCLTLIFAAIRGHQETGLYPEEDLAIG